MQGLKEVIGVNSSTFLFCYPRNKSFVSFFSFRKNTVTAAEERKRRQNPSSRVIHLMKGAASQILFLNGLCSSFVLWVMDWVSLAEALAGKITVKIMFLEHGR